MPGTCPSTEQLRAALREEQSSSADATLAAHLAECPTCQARLEELAGGSGWLKERAKAHTKSAKTDTDTLRKAMQALESQSPSPEAAPADSTALLNFLHRPDEPGGLGRFGPYEVLESIAIGGMGIVLKARDPGLSRIVALKILPPALAANSLARARFIREARAAAAVVHEHVVPIYAVDEIAGLPYLVMQFVQGRTLSERIRATGPLQVEEILRIGAQTAAGLAAAHEQGLIHRDVKPGNILLENGVERVKITDFGLARATDDSSLTHDGHVAGTPEYMSPEQANGAVVDQRSDLFSLGCVLYEMATGISPFRAPRSMAALRRVCEENPPQAHTLNPRIPEWLSQLIQKLMAKDAKARPQTAAEVAEELGRQLAEFQQSSKPDRAGNGSPTRTSGNHGPRTPLVWLLLLIVLLVVVLALFYLKQPKPAPNGTSKAASSSVEPEQNAISGTLAVHVFFLPASAQRKEQGFATLAEAVRAASAGAVIECRFNGARTMSSLDLGAKPLILRAASGFEPVLVIPQSDAPPLSTQAALVLEGLTVVNQPSSNLSFDRIGQPVGTGISVARAPFLAAHCRFAMESDSALPKVPPPECVRLLNVPTAQFLNCEFVTRRGFAIAWTAIPTSAGTLATNTLIVRGSTFHGNFVSKAGRAEACSQLALHGNTFCGETLVMLAGGAPSLPIQAEATDNVFALDNMVLLLPRRTESCAVERLVRWNGSSNAYAVETAYVSCDPQVATHEEWEGSDATVTLAAVSTDLGLKARVENLTNYTRVAEDAAFAITPEEQQRLPANLGADAEHNGPGKSYDDWRASPAYHDWQKLVREHLPEVAADN